MATFHHAPTGHATHARVHHRRTWRRHAAWCLGTCLLSALMLAAGSLVRANTATLSVVVPKPYITSLTPSTIRAEGTAVIAVSGTGFTSAVYTIEHVTMNGIPAASFTVEGPDSLSFVTPLLSPGSYDVVVTTSTGVASQPTASGDNTLNVVPNAASPSQVPSPTASALASPVPLQPTPTPSPSPSATLRPTPLHHPHRTTPHPPAGHRTPSSGVGAITQAVTHFVQHHVIIVSSLVIVILLLLIVLLLAKRRRRKPDLESRLKL